jgi:hypothetical protein
MNRHHRLISMILAGIFVMAGCAPGPEATPPADVNAVVQQTVVAMETKVIADLTAQAPLPTPTLPPTQVSMAETTPTPVPAVPTFPPTPTALVIIFPSTSSGGSSSSGSGGGGSSSSSADFACALVSQKPVDGAYLSPKTDFDMVWKVKNTGKKSWEVTDVDFYFVSGDHLHQNASNYDLPSRVKPGGTIELTVDMAAPKDPGTYKTSWGLGGPKTFCTLTLILRVAK